ncbi:MAG: hypothetical protein HOL51_00605 [Gemmatimonadetes bacterium]|nr:hypothetical protein [Gemmatimonadota bacterium]MBT5324596.1 hypothetical protein [Gemmatimonadota bacterium]MBT5451010.1 hypothetical protein [Gemmatimonadota bacterium]MBT5802540.1 hypothetical protein [Gemmatimonadota bacterium]MBT6621349.1 hypothetical protein [Gemmatimonadota bacterium]
MAGRSALMRSKVLLRISAVACRVPTMQGKLYSRVAVVLEEADKTIRFV